MEDDFMDIRTVNAGTRSSGSGKQRNRVKAQCASRPSKEGNGPWRLISTPKSEFLEKIRRIKIFYAQFIFICAVFNYNPAFPTKSANLGLTMHISLASSRDRADYHAHATILMRTSPRSNHE